MTNETPSNLLNEDWVQQFSDVAFAQYHGVENAYLGTGALYYSIAYAKKAETCVCLGSGGGLVPLLMRQAQWDCGRGSGRTFLVDAIAPENGWGSPLGPGGWAISDIKENSLFAEIQIIRQRTVDAAKFFFRVEDISIDYLHIDADHTMEGCYNDVEAFLPLLSPASVLTLHDTRYSSVQKAIAFLKHFHPEYDVVDFPELAQGTAIARRRLPHTVASEIPHARPDPEKDVSKGEALRQMRQASEGSDPPDETVA